MSIRRAASRPPSIWASRPADLYGRRDHDRFTAVLWGVRAVFEGFASVSRWHPARVKPVQRKLTAVVTKREFAAPDVVALTLADPDGGLLPSWTPGAHIDVLLPSGRRRQYSPGHRGEYRIAVRRIADGGGGSIEMHEAFGVGDTVEFEGPRNAFYLGTAEHDVLFVIGGIGVTPILPMIRVAAQRGIDWRAIYTGRSREYMPLLDEVVSVDPQRVTVWADDEHGRFPTAAELLAAAGTCAARAPCSRPSGSPGTNMPARHCITSGSARRRSSTVSRSSWSWRDHGRCSPCRRTGRRWTSCSTATRRHRIRAGKDSAAPAG